MLEKIARAICEASGQSWGGASSGYSEICTEFAIAAVKALREPTDEMLEASNREWDGRMSFRSSGAWQAMIDSILPTQPQEQER